jgi:ATP-dependent Lon protease
MSQIKTLPIEQTVLPLLPLRDVVIFPHMVTPLFVGRPKSILALESAMADKKLIMLVSQKQATKDDPTFEDLYTIGVVATILQMLKLPDGTVKVLVEGVQRAELKTFSDSEDGFFIGDLTPIPVEEVAPSSQAQALRRALFSQFDQYVKLNKKIPPEILQSLGNIEDVNRLADTIAANLPIKIEYKQEMLETLDVLKRLEVILGQLETEIDILQVEKRIRGRVKRQMEKSQREYYLNEQVKAIQKELGDGEEGADLEELEKKIIAAKMSKEAKTKADGELKKLKLMSPMSAEATVVRNYLDTLISLPWHKKTKVNNDLHNAEHVLNEEHYGLEKVKERIVEYLAVQQRVDKVKAPILCLVGPPGVGKTSLGQSIARATNRKYVRMALGGVRDEAEIRGHRRTYIGAMPGKILSGLIKTEVRNPLFLLDEIDKMAQDYRGDPASALLEVLDPEQNHTFQDHYVEVDFDLSDVMFVATSNSMNMPPALLDRMEVIRLSGYTEDEKISIALKYLLPKQIKLNGLNATEVTVNEDAVRDIVRYYTREAGVRSLDREMAKICRKVVTEVVKLSSLAKTSAVADKESVASKDKDEKPARKSNSKIKATAVSVIVNSSNLDKYLGVRKYNYGKAETDNQIGQVTGLAWTEVGGELLTIEASSVPGKGTFQFTGKLGDVMQESIKAALSVVRQRAQRLGIRKVLFEKRDLHIHVPEGATPKDGPSAGIAMTTALVSVLTGIPIKASVAMTGEVTLRGEVLAIGGLKEKLLAAHRGGIKTVLIPEENVKDLEDDIPEKIKQDLEIIPVRWIDQVLATALERAPTALPDEDDIEIDVKAKESLALGVGQLPVEKKIKTPSKSKESIKH